MLKSLHIKNFRCFRDLQVEPLKRVNLITGQNNTGKTGVLEALTLLLDEPAQLLDGPVPSRMFLSGNLPNLFRVTGNGENNENENFWKWLFKNKNSESSIELKAVFDTAADFELQLETETGGAQPDRQIGLVWAYATGERKFAGHKPAIFSTHPSDPVKDAIDYNRVILKRRKRQVEKMLQAIEPRLEAVETLQTGPSPLIYADLGLSEMIPVTQLGQGFNRLLDIYSEIVAADAKVLLIDEIENGLHHSVMPVIWKGLFLAAKEFDVQIFATTHSWECILAADEAARAGENYDLALIRLDRVQEDIKATVIDEKSLSTAKELQWEMR